MGVWKLSEDGKTVVSEGIFASKEEALEACKRFIDQLEESNRLSDGAIKERKL